MKRLYQEIQDQINDLMNSKVARRTDAQLLRDDKQSVVTSEIIKRSIEMYSNGFSMKEIAIQFQLNRGTIRNILKNQGVDTFENNSTGLVKRKIHEEKTNDILNGMGVHEFCEKWNCPYKGYYDKKWRVKRKFEKDLADSK